MAGKRKGTTPRWGDATAIEGMLEAQEDLEAEEAQRAEDDRVVAEADGLEGAVVPLDNSGPGFGAFIPTPEQRAFVKDMARCGMPQEAMCLMVKWPNGRPVSQRTLRHNFAEEIVNGHIEVGMQLVGSLYKKAMSGDVGALCFMLKTGYGFRETVHQEITGKDGKDLPGLTGVIVMPAMADSAEWERSVAAEQLELQQRANDFMSGTGEFAKPDKLQ